MVSLECPQRSAASTGKKKKKNLTKNIKHNQHPYPDLVFIIIFFFKKNCKLVDGMY